MGYRVAPLDETSSGVLSYLERVLSVIAGQDVILVAYVYRPPTKEPAP
jgi:hypothetical protein